jgi:hypothetical protein
MTISSARNACQKKRTAYISQNGHPLSPNPNTLIVQLRFLGKRHPVNLRALRPEVCKERKAKLQRNRGHFAKLMQSRGLAWLMQPRGLGNVIHRT